MINLPKHIKSLVIWTVGWEFIFWTIVVCFTFFNSTSSTEYVQQWKNPEFFWLSLFMIPIYAYYFHRKWQLSKILSNIPFHLRSEIFPGASLSVSFWPLFFLRNTFVFLIMSAAQPIAGKEKVSSSTSTGEIVICLDVSNSMNTKDIDPSTSRLEIAKRAMNELLNHLTGERIGIAVFAENAFVQLPITSDYSAAKLYINDIESSMLSNQGTNIAAALSTSLKQFSPEKSTKTIILVTDGEDHAKDTDSVMNAIKTQNINLCVVGLGSPTGGAIPIHPSRPELGYKKDEQGRLVVSKPNEALIKELADGTDGISVMVNDPYPSLDELLTEINQKQGRKKGNLQVEIQQNNYRIPLFFALLSWLGWMWFNYSRRTKSRK